MSAPVFEDAIMPKDTTPPVSDVEYPCEVCGNEAGPYGGRGRKPKYCADHRRGPTRKNTSGIKVTGTNDTLARQATEALCQINGFLALGAMVLSLHATAATIAEAQDTFREQTHAALLTDPDLCRTILKAGVKSGKLALLISYVMFGAAVVPVAVMEIKQKKAERDALKAEAEEQE